MEQSDSDDESFTLSLPDFSDSDSHDGSGSMGTDYSDNELYNEVYDDDIYYNERDGIDENQAFMRTTVPLFGVGHTTLVPFNGTIKQNEVDEEFEDIVDHFETESVQVATCRQNTAEWFLARRFRITGTSALILWKHVAKKDYKKDFPDDAVYIESILKIIGLTKTATYSASDTERLLRMGKDELTAILQRGGLVSTGTKAQLVQRITQQRVQISDVINHGNDVDLTTKLMKTWFMKPRKGTTSTYIGSHNETNVKTELPNFLFEHSGATRIQIMQTFDYGLLLHGDWQAFGFSPDGICVTRQLLPLDNGTLHGIITIGLIEIKTKTTKDTARPEHERAREFGKFVVIDIEDENDYDLFCRAIPDIDHRVQLLHGMGIGNIENAFYVVANQHNIIRVVLVQANTWFTEHYVTALYRAFCNEGLASFFRYDSLSKR